MSMKTIEIGSQVKERMMMRGIEFSFNNREERERQVNFFKQRLEEMLIKYHDDISKNPEVRNKINNLCRRMGVEPLKTEKTMFGSLFGKSEFYDELTVQIIEECYKSRESNGGIIEIKNLCKLINEKRKTTTLVTLNDISEAIKTASCLGNGLKIITIHDQQFLISVPFELADDQRIILELLEKKSYFLEGELESLGWSKERIKGTCMGLLNLGVLWIDDQYLYESKITRAYWMSLCTSF